MSNEDEFFAEMHPQIAQVIGIAVMQLLVEKREPSREALIEMIQVLWQGNRVELAVERKRRLSTVWQILIFLRG